MKRLKAGIIGLGNMGTIHARNVLEMPELALSAICDIVPDALNRINPADGIARYTEPERFMREGEMDLVIISVPHYAHPDLALMALDYGRHIIVEKPVAVHKAEAERLLTGASRYPALKKAAMFNQRIMPVHKKIRQLLVSGELGKILRINWTITDWFRSQCYYDSGGWRASWRGEGGGVLLNQCPHQLDLMQWFFGMPATVRAEVKLGKYHDIEVEDEVNAYLEYDDGKTANFIASTGEIPGTNRLEIMAERGRLVYESGNLEFMRSEEPASRYCRTTSRRFGIPDVWNCRIPVGAPETRPHRAIIADTVSAIVHDTPLISPLEDGLRSLELGNAMLLSGLKGKTVELPMDASEYAEMLNELVAGSRCRGAKIKSSSKSADFINSF